MLILLTLILREIMIKKLIVSLFCLFATLAGYSQIDTVFWFSAPDVSSSVSQGDAPIYIRCVTYADPAIITISQPANGAFTPIVFSIPANSVDSINLSFYLSSIENTTANVVNNKGLKISATKPISAIYELKSANNKEFVSLKGQKALGTDFYTPFQKAWANGTVTPQSFSSIEIVATQNATTVLITPRTAVIGPHAANVSYTVALNAGETYTVRDTNRTAATSLAGSIVSANNPIALTLFSGALNNNGSFSCVMDQITTSDYLGTDFVIRKGMGSDERVFILATQNATTVDVFGASSSSSLINWSETKEIALTDSVTYIKTSKPVYTWHVAGFGNKMSGAQVPHVYCAGTYTTSVTRTSTDSFGLILFVRSGFEGNFALNGNASLIPASAFAPVPGTSGALVCARIFYSNATIPIHSIVRVTNTADVFGMGVLQGNSTGGNSYAYFSDFTSYPFVNAGTDVTTCANSPVNINGLVGGGAVTGNWTTNGFGSFQSSSTTLNNVYIPSDLDTALSPIRLILTSTGPCPVKRDTFMLNVTPAPIISASADQTICANVGTIALNGSASGGTSTGVWTANGSGTFVGGASNLNSSYQFSTSDTLTGNVVFVLTSTNVGTCNVETDTMIVTITDAPTVDAGPSSISVCANNPNVALSGVVSGPTNSGKWTTSGLGIFNPNNTLLTTQFQPNPSDILGGQIMVYLTSTNNGTCLPVKDSIEVVFTSSPQVNAGNNGFACTNSSSIQLNGTVTGATSTGYWTGGSGTYLPDSSAITGVYQPSAAEISNGSVILTLITTNNGNCTAASDFVKFDFVAPPFANFSFTDECFNTQNEFTNFSLQGFGSITQWNYDFGDGSNSNQANTTHFYNAPGTYNTTLVVTSSVGCTDTITKTVSVFANPVVAFTDSLKCSGNLVLANFYDASTIPAPEVVDSWTWDFGGAGGSSLQNPIAVFTNSGTYQIKLTIRTANGCSNSNDIQYVIPGLPNANFFYNTTPGFNVGAVVNFVDSSSNAYYNSWSFGDGGTSNEVDPTHTYFANDTFNVVYVVSNQIGCTDTAKASIIITSVSDEITTLIPNAISPNGDGKNDVWKLPFLDLLYPKATIEIFNRWGQQIFYSEGYTSPWNGTYKGEDLPMGNYYYILNLNDSSKPEVYKGAILLVR